MSKICYNCFREMGPEDSQCPHCGYIDEPNRSKFPQALPQGTVLNAQYIVGRVLGQGGFGITYIALNNDDQRLVAVKEYFPSANATRTTNTDVVPFNGEKGEAYDYGMECFVNEALILAKFTGNANIANVDSCFKENNTAYYVMEYVNGTSFEKAIQEAFETRGGMRWEEVQEVTDALLNALTAVHSEGIIHRDIAPDNIFITNEGVVKLLDFGAARYSLGNATHSLDVVLKHGFAPKEQYSRRGKQGPYTDIYATAATMYYALTGHKPPDAIDRSDQDDMAMPSAMHLRYPITQEQEAVLLKALSVDAYDRYQSAAEFRKKLREVTVTSYSIYNKALAAMTVNPMLSVSEQVAQYQKAISLFEQALSMSDSYEMQEACREGIQQCQNAIGNTVDYVLQTAEQEAQTPPGSENAETAYQKALDLIGSTSQLNTSEEVGRIIESIQRTCSDNMRKHALVKQLNYAKHLIDSPMPKKEKKAAYQEAKAILEEVRSQADGQELQAECDAYILRCEEGLRKSSGNTGLIILGAAAAVVLVIVLLVAFMRPTKQTYVAAPAQPQILVPMISAKVTANDCYLNVNLSSAYDRSSVVFQVWSEENGKDDLRQYTPQLNEGNWVSNIKLTDLGVTGTYCVEAYDVSGGAEEALANTKVNIEEIMVTSLGVRLKENSATIAVEMEQVPGYDNVTFAVWGNENDGNDLTWYTAENSGGLWQLNIDLLNHNEQGTYFIHAYADRNGENVKVARAEVLVHKIVRPEVVGYTEFNGRDLHIAVNNAEGYKIVNVRVQRKSDGPGRESWRTAELNSDGVWRCTFNLREFSGPDTFQIQVYGKKNDSDQEKVIGESSVEVTEIMPYDLISEVYAKERKVWLAMFCDPSYEDVRVVVWANGKSDDQKWYPGTKAEDGSWQWSLDLGAHSRSNEYIVHAYCTINGVDCHIATAVINLG